MIHLVDILIFVCLIPISIKLNRMGKNDEFGKPKPKTKEYEDKCQKFQEKYGKDTKNISDKY